MLCVLAKISRKKAVKLAAKLTADAKKEEDGHWKRKRTKKSERSATNKDDDGDGNGSVKRRKLSTSVVAARKMKRDKTRRGKSVVRTNKAKASVSSQVVTEEDGNETVKRSKMGRKRKKTASASDVKPASVSPAQQDDKVAIRVIKSAGRRNKIPRKTASL